MSNAQPIDTPSSSKQPLETLPPSEKPHFQRETTGNFWQDLVLAFKPSKRIGRHDLERENFERIPCMRSSMLNGIATGAGIGVIRGLSTGRPIAGVNWAVGTFIVVSAGSMHICRTKLEEERKKVQQIIETMPKRSIKKTEGGPPPQDT